MTEQIHEAPHRIDVQMDPFGGEELRPLFADGRSPRLLQLPSRPDKLYRLQPGYFHGWDITQKRVDEYEGLLATLAKTPGLIVPGHRYIGREQTGELWTEVAIIHGEDLENLDRTSLLRPTDQQLSAMVESIVSNYETVPESDLYLRDLAYRQLRFGSSTEGTSPEINFHDLDMETEVPSYFGAAGNIEVRAKELFTRLEGDFGLEFPEARERMNAVVEYVGQLSA